MAKQNATAADIAKLTQQLADLQAQNDRLAAQLAGGLGHGSASKYVWQGHSLTGLVRSMAGVGWGPGAISRVLVGLGFPANPSTIQTQRQLAKGNAKKGIAPKAGPALTPGQWAHLQACLSAAAPPAFTPAGLLPQGQQPAPLADPADLGNGDLDQAV